jgi:hypothetical protein
VRTIVLIIKLELPTIYEHILDFHFAIGFEDLQPWTGFEVICDQIFSSAFDRQPPNVREVPRWVHSLNATYASFAEGNLQIFDLVREVDILVTVEDIVNGKI